MKIVVVNGAPRARGATCKIAGEFCEGVRESGAELARFDLRSCAVSLCRGCFACSVEGAAKCVISDDMAKILSAISECDALACFTPLYFYSMSAQMKIFLDRCFPFVRGYFSARKSEGEGRVSLEKKFPLFGKKFATVAVSAGRDTAAFAPLSQTWKSVADAFGLEHVADIRRGESPYLGELGENSVRVKKIFSAFRASGKSFGADGTISADTVELAESKLSPSEEIFTRKSGDYWRLIRKGKFFL